MRALFWSLIRSILFRFDAESAHRFTLNLIRLSMRMGNLPLRVLVGGEKSPSSPLIPSRWTVLGMTFDSPVGLAAGFDKDAEILAALPDLGFGFAEVGTVTPRPQPGNDRPRLFRDPASSSLFNRMGFNGLGAEIVSANLAAVRPSLPPGFRIGVNIGKNKDTPIERAAEDYRKAIRPFRDLADYVVINVSSPNTPGLRSLQTVASLTPIVSEVSEEVAQWSRKAPILLKLAPELLGEDLKEVILALEERKIAGWVLTNTLAGEKKTSSASFTGGWSGGVLTAHARVSLQEVRSISQLPIISVGGILTSDEARARIDSGASLVQIYSGWIYRGPTFPQEIKKALISR